MAQSKFHVVQVHQARRRSWRYCKAAFYSNGKIKPNRCIIGGKEEEHPEGSYYLYHRRVGCPWAQMHWMHNVSGMPGLTMMSSSGCKERLRCRPRMSSRLRLSARLQTPWKNGATRPRQTGSARLISPTRSPRSTFSNSAPRRPWTVLTARTC